MNQISSRENVVEKICAGVVICTTCHVNHLKRMPFCTASERRMKPAYKPPAPETFIPFGKKCPEKDCNGVLMHKRLVRQNIVTLCSKNVERHKTSFNKQTKIIYKKISVHLSQGSTNKVNNDRHVSKIPCLKRTSIYLSKKSVCLKVLTRALVIQSTVIKLWRNIHYQNQLQPSLILYPFLLGSHGGKVMWFCALIYN